MIVQDAKKKYQRITVRLFKDFWFVFAPHFDHIHTRVKLQFDIKAAFDL